MELNRRNFVKLIVGGAAGITATPLPWKLTDDIAIFTQNFPWLNEPPVGEFTHETSVCKLCPGGCGIEVRKVDQRAVKIEGRTDYPVNPGGICPLGAGGLQLLYNENLRYTSPMKRVGPRGSGKFQNISWKEGLKELSGRILQLRKKGHPEALAAIDGNYLRSSISLLVQRFLEAIGSPNYMIVPTAEETYTTANILMMGNMGPAAYDLENADHILSFGCGLIEGWGAPGRVFNAWGLWREDPLKGKTKIVQIESRASNTASKADQWVATLPGTETALALGIAHVIIKERLYDTGFVDNYTFGFNDWTSGNGKSHMGFKTLILKKYSPEAVGSVTGLKPGEIIALAKDFANAKAPLALCGKGKGDLNGSLFEFMAIQGLNALVGNVNRPGGVLIHNSIPLSPFPEFERDVIAKRGLGNTRFDLAGTARFPFTPSLINNLADTINNSPESPVDTLLIFSGNPVFNLPSGRSLNTALKKIPYIISFSPFKDETSMMADLILPDHTCLEKLDDVVWPAGLQYPLYGLTRPVVEPLYDTRNTGDVIIELAGMIGGAVSKAFPWKSFEESLKSRAKGLFDSGGGLTHYDEDTPVWEGFAGHGAAKSDYTSFDDMWRKIKSGGLWYRPTHNFKNWDTVFKTPTGKFEFFSSKMELAVIDLAKKTSIRSALKDWGIRATGDEAFMPHYESSLTGDDRKEQMVPYELINLSSGWLPNPPYLKKTLFDHQLRKNESFAEINPVTASKYDLEEGDRISIKSEAGELQVKVHLFEGAMPGVVYLPLGFGHSAYDDFHQDQGANPNEIIAGGRDPLSGHPIWWNTPIEIVKI